MLSFEDKLLSDIEERYSALFEIERALFTDRYKLTQKHSDILSLQSISMIYSIWEGFIQKAFNLYIDEINKFNINLMDVNDELIIYQMEDSFKQFKEYPEKHRSKVSFFEKLKSFIDDNKVKIKTGINTQSNVSFDVLNYLLKAFCLQTFNEHWKKYTYPNPNLKESLITFLRYRNGISHGGDISSEEKVTQEVYEKYKCLIGDLMYEVMFKMKEGLSNNTFLK